jgi:hypothetical protein
MRDLTQDKIIWLFLFFTVFLLYLLAAFDPTQRAVVIDLTTKTLIPLLLREVVGGIVHKEM